MAYVPGSPARIAGGITNSVPGVWVFKNTDTDATVYAANYISDGQTLGMKIGDIVIYVLTTTPIGYIHMVVSLGTGKSVNLSATSVPVLQI